MAHGSWKKPSRQYTALYLKNAWTCATNVPNSVQGTTEALARPQRPQELPFGQRTSRDLYSECMQSICFVGWAGDIVMRAGRDLLDVCCRCWQGDWRLEA